MNSTPNKTILQVCNQLKKRAEDFPFSKVKKYKLEKPKYIIFSQLNVNSLRNKFFPIAQLIKTKLEIFLAADTSADQSFPTQQFSIDGNKVSNKDRKSFGGVLLFCMNENMLCRELTAAEIGSSSETSFLDITLHTRKLLDIDCYLQATKSK